MKLDISDYLKAIKNCETVPRSGRVVQFYGSIVESQGPDVYLGELCEIFPPSQVAPVMAEVVGFRDGRVLLVPYGNLHGIQVHSEVIALGKSASVRVGEDLMGRVIDAFGKPLDGTPLSADGVEYSLYPPPSNPLDRERITGIFETGVSCIDGFLTVGKGQRLGIFAGSGVGKSTLLGMIASHSRADVNVIALIGERGREVLDFLEKDLGGEGLKKSVIVVAAADQPALVRARAAYVATSIAEHYAKAGRDVMLAMDSITRFAMATRETGLAAGEPPTARGYTPSTFSALPKLLERAGNYKGAGSITAFYTVLVEGDDFNEPIADNLRAILDGHAVLTRELANKGQFPAVDVLQSISRIQGDLISAENRELVNRIRNLLSVYKESSDLIDMGAYEKGRNKALDQALVLLPKINTFVAQAPGIARNYSTTMDGLRNILRTQVQ